MKREGILNARRQTRHARKALDCAVVIRARTGTWNTRSENISSTGLAMRRPVEWHPTLGEVVEILLDMVDVPPLAIVCRVVRIDTPRIALAFDAVPLTSETRLWSLLGYYADRYE